MHLTEINRPLIDHALTWEQYVTRLAGYVESGSTSGLEITDKRIADTKVNLQRVKRIDKTTEISENIDHHIRSVDNQLIVLAVGEAWCGDGAQITGVVAKLCSLNPKLTFRFIFRDEHPEVIDRFLTNGGRAVPIFILIDAETFDVIGHWGPRPSELQKLVSEWKLTVDKETLGENIHKWYAQDKTISVQREFTAYLIGRLKSHALIL